MVLDTWKDIDINFYRQQDGDIKSDYHIEAVKNSIENILRTMPGWRRMLPEFASNLWHILFEPMDEQTANEIGERLLEAIQIWDNRVTVHNIHINANYQYYQYEISLTFSIANLVADPQTIETTLKAV